MLHIQRVADLGSAVDVNERSDGNLIQEEMYIEKQHKEIVVSGTRKMDYEHVDRLVKSQKRVRKRSQKAASCDQNRHEESIFSEGFGTMFLDRNFMEGSSFERKPFTSALEVLNSEKGTIFNAIFSGYGGERDENHGYMLSKEKGHRSKRLLETVDARCDSPLPSSEIVILKPATLKSRKYSFDASFRCSSERSDESLSYTAPDAKTASFSFGEMKRKLKYAFGGTRDEPNQFMMGCSPQKLPHNKTALSIGYGCIYRGVDTRESLASNKAKIRDKSYKKKELQTNTGPDDVILARKKVDFSNIELRMKQEFDVLLEAKKHLSSRLKSLKETGSPTGKRSQRTLRRILLSPEHEVWPHSPRRDSHSTTESSSLSPSRPMNKLMSSGDQKKHDFVLKTSSSNTNSSLLQTADKAHDTLVCTEDNVMSIDELQITEPELNTNESPRNIRHFDATIAMQRTDTVESRDQDGNTMHYAFDLNSENETLTSRTEDFPSSPSSMSQLDMADNIKYREHQSPDSVLEPFFSEEVNSPSNMSIRIERQPLCRLRLDFEEPQHDLPISRKESISQWDYISLYVHLVLQASCLNWDRLSEIRLTPDHEFLHESLFEEVEFPTSPDSVFDPKLLFDHMNEVLTQLHRSRFCSLPFVKQKTGYNYSLEELVLDEIAKEPDFYLLPWTEHRTLDQIVSKDVASSQSWLDVRHDVEQIVSDISDNVVEETILDTLIELHR